MPGEASISIPRVSLVTWSSAQQVRRVQVSSASPGLGLLLSNLQMSEAPGNMYHIVKHSGASFRLDYLAIH